MGYQMHQRNTATKVNTTRSTRSTRKHLKAFTRLASADRYATACAAAYRLSCDLLALGQPQATIAADLAALSGLLPVLLVAEIVQAASERAEGGQQ